jgi:hypothetical protein
MNYAVKKNIRYLWALPELEIKTVQGDFVCPLSLSKFGRTWKYKFFVENGKRQGMMDHCRTNHLYNTRQSLKKHLRDRGKDEPMHKYMLEFMEEWAKQY